MVVARLNEIVSCYKQGKADVNGRLLGVKDVLDALVALVTVQDAELARLTKIHEGATTPEVVETPAKTKK